MYLYSKSKGGFYRKDVHTEIPDDAIEIDKDDYSSFFKNQAAGKIQNFNAKTKKFVVKK